MENDYALHCETGFRNAQLWRKAKVPLVSSSESHSEPLVCPPPTAPQQHQADRESVQRRAGSPRGPAALQCFQSPLIPL